MKSILSFILSSFAIIQTMSADVMVVAHRGGALIGNENTLSAFANAVSLGVDMIELDVHLTKDGQVVVCHDETIKRTTDGKGRIEDMTLAEFKRAHALDRKTKKPTSETLPTLEEALELIKGHCSVLLEMKRSRKDQYPDMEQKVLDIVSKCGMQQSVVYQSFDDAVLETVHSLSPESRIEKLIFCRLPFGLCFDGKFSSFSFEKYSFCASINPMQALTSKRFVRACHKADKQIRVWTVNNPERVLEGVDAVISNRPDLFKKRSI